jgi:hypothetical protein
MRETCTTPCFGLEHRQGKGCECAMRATRACWTCDADEPIEIPLFLRVLCVLSAIFVVLMHSGLLDPFLRHF